MRLIKKLDLVVTAIEFIVIGVRVAGAVKEGLDMRKEKLSKGA